MMMMMMMVMRMITIITLTLTVQSDSVQSSVAQNHPRTGKDGFAILKVKVEIHWKLLMAFAKWVAVGAA